MDHARITRTHRILSLAAASVVLSMAGCRTDPRGADGVQLRLHSGTHCPDSHIPWDFKRQPVRYDSEFYQVANPDGPTPVPVAVPTPTIESLDCSDAVNYGARDWPGIYGTTRTETITNLQNKVRSECRGTTCEMPTACVATYTCGAGERFTVGNPNTVGQTWWTQWKPLIDCRPDVEGAEQHVRALSVDDIAYERPEGTVCVPRYCHGKARRNVDLECVTDDTIEELPLRDVSSTQDFGRLTVDINPELGRIANPSAITTARLGTSYKYDLDLNLGTHDASKFKNARLTVWLSEVFETSQGQIETFACVLASPMPTDDHGAEGNQLRYRVDIEPSPRCTDTATLVRQQLEAHGKDQGTSWKIGSRINHTLDVEGRYAIFDGSDASGDRRAIDSCAPNPLDFFPLVISDGDENEPKKQMPDMASYLRQRQIDGHLRGSNPGRFGGAGRSLSVAPASTNTRLGMLEVDIGKAKVAVVSDGRETTEIPVDFTWFQANHGQKEPVILPDADRLQAGIYLWPTNRAGEKGNYLRIGTADLLTAARTGNSVATKATLDASIKKQIFDPNSPFHISRNQFMRSFEVIACLEVRGLDGRYFAQQQVLQAGGRAFGKGIDSLDYAGYTPAGGLNPGPACRYSKTPLLVEALYLSYPVEPESDKPREQQTAAVRTGNGKLGATQNSDTDMGCAATPGASCRNSSNSSLSSGGSVARSFYASRNRQEQAPPARGQAPGANNSISLDGNAEVFGMQVLDLVASETSRRVTWPQPAVTLEARLAIPLDKAAERLRMAATGHTVEWKQGRYGGQDGLGLAIGTKILFQLGPIPGELKIAFSMGISAAVFSTFTYYDSDVASGAATSFGNAYPCLDGKICSRIELDDNSNELSLPFAGAVNYCRQRGGRLAQLDTTEAAASYLAALGSRGRYWSGGQQAWVYRDPQCDRVFTTSCLTNAISSYRWLSDNTEYARADGAGSAVWNASPAYYFGAAQPSFSSSLPTISAMVIDASNDSPSFQAVSGSFGVVCEYPAADYDLYQSNTFGLELAAAAGFGMSLCVPGDKIGICLGGGINVASITFKPQFQHEYHQVYLGNRLVHRAGQVGFVGPWSLTLLDGEIYAEIHFFFFSIKHSILTFSGFQVAGGKFFDTRTPFVTPGEMQ
jgi:hypothetical protein